MHPTDRTRLDKWLWAARFFKTRALAAQAVRGGKAHVNGARVKMSRAVSIGDELSIRKGAAKIIVVVEALSERRGPAQEARTLYRETRASIEARETFREQCRLSALTRPAPPRRPDKKARRQLRRLVQREGDY